MSKADMEVKQDLAVSVMIMIILEQKCCDCFGITYPGYGKGYASAECCIESHSFLTFLSGSV